MDGLIAGWALGAWEAGLVLSNAHYAGTLWIYVLVPLVSLGLYGWGGWLLARLLPAGPRWVWTALLVLGVCVISYFERHQVALTGWPATVAGTLVFLALARAAVAGRAQRLPRILGVASLSLPAVLLLVLTRFVAEDAVDRPAPPGPAPDGPSVVLVTWDTVRADTLPLYGGGGLDMPELARLAAEGALLEDFQAVASITAPAHASMLSGLYPPSHGLRSNGQRFHTEGLPLLPQMLRNAGYATGAFVSGYPIRARFGFDAGFERFDDRSEATSWALLLQLGRFSSALLRVVLPEELRATYTVPGDLTVARASAWLESQERPFFLWVHLFDAHGPYLPPDEFRDAVLARRAEGPHAVAQQVEEHLILQRGEIAWLDSLLGDLREALERRDPDLRDTLIILVADHGECFGEGGLIENHEASLFAATQHVPAIVRLPGSVAGAPRGVRLAAAASQVDLLPTVLDFLGGPIPPDAQGRSLLPVLLGRGEARAAARGRYMEAFQHRLGQNKLSGWLRDGWKAIWALDGTTALYHDAAGGTVDLAAEQPELLQELLQEGRAFLQSIPIRELGEAELAPFDRNALEQLGYLHSGGGN